MTSNDVDKNAEIIWDYMLMKQPLEKMDTILALGSIDERVAEYAAELFLKGYGKWLIFSGGVGHKNDLLKTGWLEETEAAHFAAIAVTKGIPEDKIITEDKSTNTGENIRFTYELLKKQQINPPSLVLVQKPYMERRTYATFKKQWPDESTEFRVTSPPIPYEQYFNESNPKEMVINIMIGDLQRIKEYPKLGFQIEQEIPEEVWQAYENLVASGYTHHLVRTR